MEEEGIKSLLANVTLSSYMNPLYKQYADELNPYVIDFEKEGLEGVKGKLIFVFLKDEHGGYGFKSRNLSAAGYSAAYLFGKSRYEVRMEERSFLSQDGILIKKITGLEFALKNILPLWIEGGSIFFNINLEDAAKIDLTIDRNEVLPNSKLNNLQTRIEEIIIDHIEKIFSQKHLVTDKDKNKFMGHFF